MKKSNRFIGIKNKMIYRCAACSKKMQAFEGIVSAKKDDYVRIYFHKSCIDQIMKE